VTYGELLKGVRFHAGEATTQILVMRSISGTALLFDAHHQLTKLNGKSSINYALGVWFINKGYVALAS